VVLVTVLFPRIRSQVGVTPSKPKSAAKLHSFGMRVSDISVLVGAVGVSAPQTGKTLCCWRMNNRC
jgi:hypothetical protein